MRTFLLVVVAAVLIAGVIRLFRLRGDEHVRALSLAVAGESVYLAGMLGFLAWHADWLPWHVMLVFACMTVVGALLLRVVLAVTALPWPAPVARRAPTPGYAACYVAGLTLVIVLPVVLTEPDPQPPSATGAAARQFGGRIDAVVSISEQSTPAQGEAVPVEQYSFDGRRLALVVAHHLQCVPRAVTLTRDGDALTVTVVAGPAPRAGEIFRAESGAGRCAPAGPFTWRTVVNVRTTGGFSSVTDGGADGAARRAP
ncbi:hypothetical protein AB0M20_05090 [Actinoplanes sp. NPDC051633]|uniref:hypothetical protein n=1 Tax=Actinoplanes sp. NPDC051633 TaxID=3155670 RepID=UPI00342B0F82